MPGSITVCVDCCDGVCCNAKKKLGLGDTQGLHLPPESRDHLAGVGACQAARCQPVQEMLCCTCCSLQLAIHLQASGFRDQLGSGCEDQ